MPYYSAQLNTVYKPAVRDISAITQTDPVVVTTTFPHSYLTGLILRLYVPPAYGMQQLNRRKGEITVTSPTTFTMPFNGTVMDAFVVPPDPSIPTAPLSNSAQSVPIGENTAILTQSFVNVLKPQF